MKTRQQSRLISQPSMANLKRGTDAADGGPRPKRSAFGDITNAFKHSVIIDSAKRQQLTRAVSEPAKDKHREPEATSSSDNSLSGDDLSTRDRFAQNSQDSSVETDVFISASQGSSSSDSNDEGKCGSQDSSLEVQLNTESQQDQDSLDEVEFTEVEVDGTHDGGRTQTSPDDYDFDKEQEMDPFHCPQYANDIFLYYRKREAVFRVGDYITRQPTISRQMRAILVDWMIEVQENFELNHETLYQAVKIVDLYLDRTTVSKETLQLVGSTALFLAAKFDERQPPLADDFLYICDDAYTRDQLIAMEQTVLRTLDFDIGMPLSYRYVRRYAKTTKADMTVLTLSRYILETSLMHYDFVQSSESMLAAAAFLLAVKMTKTGDWTPLHVKYSGYNKEEILPIARRLNAMLRGDPPAKNVKTVLEKYSHEVFLKVALIPTLAEL